MVRRKERNEALQTRKNYRQKNGISDSVRVKLCSDSRSNRETNNQDSKKENKDMSNSNNSNRLVVPGAREAMDKFKMEAANDLAVTTPS